MSNEAPPLMRKLLIGQLKEIRYGCASSSDGKLVHSVPFPPGRQLLFSLLWLQGHVVENLGLQSADPHFLLDDGTGSVLVTIQSDTELPPVGAYVSVIGAIERAIGVSQESSTKRLPSLVSWRLAARSVVNHALAEKYLANNDDETQKRAPSSAYAEIAWPLEVMDMSRAFSTPI